MESFSKEIVPKESVESTVNFEGNDTEILISRLRHPKIKEQIINVVYEQRQKDFKFYKEEDWEPHLPEGWTGEEKFKLFKGKNSGKIMSTEDLAKELSVGEPIWENLEKELDNEIDTIERFTEIDYSTNGPTSEVIPLNWIVPWTGEKATTKQMSIIEAHEKGHGIRGYNNLTEPFKLGFDLSKVEFTQNDADIIRKNIENYIDKPIGWDESKTVSLEEEKQRYLNDYLFTGMEIAERMSQLKNYFGFKGDEKFTRQHLTYAKEHYVEDTNMDNSMKMFLEAITPETEDSFLESINNYGI